MYVRDLIYLVNNHEHGKTSTSQERSSLECSFRARSLTLSQMLQCLSVATDAMESFVSSSKTFATALAEIDISVKTDDSETSGKRKRVAKTPKDPDAPKRPASSYLLFQNELRTQLKEENPNMHHNELVKHISARWASMTAEDKAVGQRVVLRFIFFSTYTTTIRCGTTVRNCSRKSMIQTMPLMLPNIQRRNSYVFCSYIDLVSVPTFVVEDNQEG